MRHAGAAQPLEQSLIARLVEPAAHRLSQHRADLGRLLQLLDRGGRASASHRPERLAPAPARRARRRGECRGRKSGARARCSGCARSARRPWRRSSRRTGARSPVRRLGRDVLVSPASCSAVKRVDVGVVATSLLSMSCAISDSPSPSMFMADREAKCSRPRCSLAGHDVFSQRQTASPSARCSAAPQRGHVGRHHPRLRVRRPPAQHRADDARDDVAGLLDDHPVAFADVLARDVVGVVQRRHRDRRAGEEHRLEHRERRHRAGAADVDVDPSQQRRLLLRGELEGDRPARELAGGAEQPALRRADRP